MLQSIKTTLATLLFASMLNAAETPEVAHTITIAGTADLQGMMEPVTQKFDLDLDGKKEEISMGGLSRISTVLKQRDCSKKMEEWRSFTDPYYSLSF